MMRREYCTIILCVYNRYFRPLFCNRTDKENSETLISIAKKVYGEGLRRTPFSHCSFIALAPTLCQSASKSLSALVVVVPESRDCGYWK
jgi:hypothetical protein